MININMNKYTAVVQRDVDFWIGWIEEICGVNSQGATREELLENLQSALQEALHMDQLYPHLFTNMNGKHNH